MQHDRAVRPGPEASRILRSEEGDHRSFSRSGEVRDTAVVTDEEDGALENGGYLTQRSAKEEVGAGIAYEGRQAAPEIPLLATSHEKNMCPVPVENALRHLRELFGTPGSRSPGGAGVDRHEGRPLGD